MYLPGNGLWPRQGPRLPLITGDRRRHRVRSTPATPKKNCAVYPKKKIILTLVLVSFLGCYCWISLLLRIRDFISWMKTVCLAFYLSHHISFFFFLSINFSPSYFFSLSHSLSFFLSIHVSFFVSLSLPLSLSFSLLFRKKRVPVDLEIYRFMIFKKKNYWQNTKKFFKKY